MILPASSGNFWPNAGSMQPKQALMFALQRMAVIVAGLPARTPDRHEQKKGPRVDAPEKAIQGFLRANDLVSTDDLQVQDDPKGAYYLLDINTPGQDTALVFAAGLPDIIRNFPWPKSMRWGAGTLRWVRPLRGLTCCLGMMSLILKSMGFAPAKQCVGTGLWPPKQAHL